MVYQGMSHLVIIKRSEEPLHGVHFTPFFLAPESCKSIWTDQ